MDQATWLSQVDEKVLEPDLPICDPHHHLWDHPNSRYLLDELLLDTSSGHNVVSTVFVECASMYRADGPEAMKPVGETGFVNGVAAMTASGRYGPIRVAAGIVSLADLTLGKCVGEVLDTHIAVGLRFKGIRHAAGCDASDAVRKSPSPRPRASLRSPGRSPRSDDRGVDRALRRVGHRHRSHADTIQNARLHHW
jgi:L-fuconolactonase